MTKINITGEFIRLDALLKFAAFCASGGNAQFGFPAGEVLVNGEACTQRGKKCRDGDIIELSGEKIQVKCS